MIQQVTQSIRNRETGYLPFVVTTDAGVLVAPGTAPSITATTVNGTAYTFIATTPTIVNNGTGRYHLEVSTQELSVDDVATFVISAPLMTSDDHVIVLTMVVAPERTVVIQ